MLVHHTGQHQLDLAPAPGCAAYRHSNEKKYSKKDESAGGQWGERAGSDWNLKSYEATRCFEPCQQRNSNTQNALSSGIIILYL